MQATLFPCHRYLFLLLIHTFFACLLNPSKGENRVSPGAEDNGCSNVNWKTTRIHFAPHCDNNWIIKTSVTHYAIDLLSRLTIKRRRRSVALNAQCTIMSFNDLFISVFSVFTKHSSKSHSEWSSLRVVGDAAVATWTFTWCPSCANKQLMRRRFGHKIRSYTRPVATNSHSQVTTLWDGNSSSSLRTTPSCNIKWNTL